MKKHLFALLIALTAFSCDTETLSPDENLPGGQSGYLVGKVTGPNGEPVPNATVHIENTVLIGKGSEITSGADGTYKIAVVEGLGQWIARGYVLREFNGRVYKIQLDPENPDSFGDGDRESPVRNFQWKLQGHYTDKSLNLFYGGTAELQRDPNSAIENTEDVLFTFEPIGKLIDGSAGKTLKLKGGKRGTQNYNFINDIPIGKYKVTAVYQPTGETLLVTDSWNNGNYDTSAIIEFMGTEASYRANQMGIGFREM